MLSQVPQGAVLKVSWTRPRSLPHHRLFFALLQKVYKNSAAPELCKSFDTFRDLVTIGAGHFEMVRLPERPPFPIAKSISFNKMGQDEFNTFFDAAMAAIERLGLVEQADLRREWLEMLAA